MKRLIILTFVAVLLLTLAVSCGQKKEATEDTSAAGHVEEVMDSTRMDSAAVDSMAGEALEQVADTAQKVVEDATGH